MAKTHPQRDNAKTLYIKNGLTAKEISDFLGVSENTLGKWVEAGGWRQLRAANAASIDNIVSRTLAQIDKIYKIAEDEERVITDNEADKIAKLSAGMRHLEKGIDPATRFTVLYDFLKFFKKVNEPAAIECAKAMPEYVNNIINARK